jgi:PIN domain nuclease of toxin-antitoxin system
VISSTEGSVLLDTSAFIWAVMDPDQLSATARAVCESSVWSLRVSPASLAEILIKVRKGKLPIEMTPAWFYRHVENLQGEYIPISARHIGRSSLLPMIHKDPFDRLLIATSLEERWPLLTCDQDIQRYPDVELIW